MSPQLGLSDLLKTLLNSTKKSQVEEVLSELEAAGALKWRDVGDNEGNFSAIAIAGNPEATFIERVTNAIDATLEAIVEEHPQLAELRSPRALVQEAFRISGGEIGSIPDKPRDRRIKFAEEIGVFVRVQRGDTNDKPTMDVRDAGTGIRPTDFPTTILSLHKRNKIRKWYVMGAYGHGGSTALRYSDYTIIVSRHRDDDRIGFTVVKLVPPSEDERAGVYVYATHPDGPDPKGNIYSVPAKDVHFDAGTLVRHVNYRFHTKAIFLNFWETSQRYLFDPVLPVVVDLKLGTQYDGHRSVYGSRDRLDRSEHVDQEAKDAFTVPLGPNGSFGTAVIRYWAFKQGTRKDTKNTFIDTNEPIVITHFGQLHASLTRHVLSKDCKLPYLADDLAVQVECDNISAEGRHKMFTANRESLTKEGKDAVESAVVSALKDEPGLRMLDDQREQRFISTSTNTAREEMKRKLAEMINRIKPGTYTIQTSGTKPGTKSKRKKPGKPTIVTPLPTSSFPTFLRIASSEDPISIPQGGTRRIELNTDAPDGFLASQGGAASLGLSEASKAQFEERKKSVDTRGGRFFLTVAPLENARPGDSLTLEIALKGVDKKNNTATFTAKRSVVVEKPPPPRGGGEIDVNAPDIVQVGPDVPEDDGRAFWTAHQWTPEHVAQVMEKESGMRIYVSVANKWLTRTLESATYSLPKKEALKSRYVLLAAFHAFIQHDNSKQLSGEDLAALEAMRKTELERATRTILTAITTEKAMDVGD